MLAGANHYLTNLGATGIGVPQFFMERLQAILHVERFDAHCDILSPSRNQEIMDDMAVQG
jgi:hypothetical protein